jgi:hypothetical protein
MHRRIEMTERNRKRSTGRQPYARKHGFYSRVLDEDEQNDFEQAMLFMASTMKSPCSGPR